MYRANAHELHTLLKDSLDYKRMMEAGLEEDIRYCLTLNAAPVVGIFRDGVIKIRDKFQN